MTSHVRLFFTWLGLAVVAMAAAALVESCSPAQAKAAPRETARAVVLAVAEAVRTADTLCATVALRIGADNRDRGRALATTCADAYDVARPATLAAATAVDAWDAGDHRGVICGLATAGRSLGQIADAVRAAGATIPPLVEDGLRLVGSLGVCS